MLKRLLGTKVHSGTLSGTFKVVYLVLVLYNGKATYTNEGRMKLGTSELQ